MEKAVLGLIGAGHLANNQHLPNLFYSERARLKTVCDVRPEAVAAAQKKYNIPNGTTDYRQLLADPEIQGVFVVTLPEQHAELTLAALRAGKHVYVEKPLAASVEECQKIVAAETASGKHVAVGFNRRFAPAYRKAKELLDANGGVFNAYYRMADTYSTTYGLKNPPGVRVYHETCHVFDILRWLFGAEIVQIYCVAAPDDDALMCTFADGRMASIISSGYASLDWPKEGLEAVAKYGGLTVDNFVEMWTYGLEGQMKRTRFRGHFHPDKEWTQRYLYEALGANAMRTLHALKPTWWKLESGQTASLGAGTEDKLMTEFVRDRMFAGNYDVDKGWLQSVEHFAECITTGTKPENASATDGLRAEQLAEAAVQSRQTGLPVKLTL